MKSIQWLIPVLVLMLLLAGCGEKAVAPTTTAPMAETSEQITQPTEEMLATEPETTLPTVPAETKLPATEPSEPIPQESESMTEEPTVETEAPEETDPIETMEDELPFVPVG